MVDLSRNPKQRPALKVLMQYNSILLYGGARSGKTFIAVYYIFARAIRFPYSRHLICRRYRVDVKGSIWDITIPLMIRMLGLASNQYSTNEQDLEITFDNGAIIVCAGTDDKARLNNLLGKDWNTIYENESNDISYLIHLMLGTRLSLAIPGCKNKQIVDLNPEGEGHWTNKIWFMGIEPQSLLPLVNPEEYGKIQMNPYDNEANLAEGYIKNKLETLTGDARERFLNGNYQSNNELLVFRSSLISYWEGAAFGEWSRGRTSMVRMVGGLDVGYQDADAFVIIAYIDGDSIAWVLYEYKAFREELEDLAKGIRKGLNEIAINYPWFQNPQMIQIYSDTNTIRFGSEGDKKKNWVELKRIYGFNTCAAFKRDKALHVELLREHFNSGQIKVPVAGMFADEITQIVWHKNPIDGTIEHVIDDEVYHPDIMFALLYAHNFLVSYGNKAWKAQAAVVLDTDPHNEAAETYERMMREQVRQEAQVDKVMQVLNQDEQFW